MSASMGQVRSQMGQILALRDRFVDVSTESDNKLALMIETAKEFRSGLEPLNKEVDQLHARLKNIQRCVSGLSHVQDFYKTGREVEKIIIDGPTASLEEYLVAMDRIKDSLSYFNQNNNEHLEYTRLTTLLSNGLKALNIRFDEILNQSFTPITPEILYKRAEKDDSISLAGGTERDQDNLGCYSISSQSIHDIQMITNWLRKAGQVTQLNADGSSTAGGGQRSHHLTRAFYGGGAGGAGQTSSSVIQLPESLNRYCDFRRDRMRVALVKLREYQKSLEKGATESGLPRGGIASSQISLTSSGRRRGMKAVGIVWDANSRRGVSNDARDVEDLDSEHYSTSLSAFLVLIDHERQLLDDLKLVTNSHEAHFAYDAICRTAASDLLSEGGSYIRLMSRAIGRGEFYMIVSLLTILRRFVDISSNFVEKFKLVNALSVPFTDILGRFRQQVKVTLDAFLQHITPGFSGSSRVPPDATVHELASTVLLFLEKLVDHEMVVGMTLTWEEAAVAPEGAFAYLTTVPSKPKMVRSALGQYILRVATAIVANIDKKAEAYSDEISRIVFQMNNLCYILKNLETTGLVNILSEYDGTAVDKLSRILAESKSVYTRSCVRSIALPPSAFISHLEKRKQMDSKERSQVKDMWSNINQGLASLIKQHTQLSIPDKDLRESLRDGLVRELVPSFTAFHDRSLQTSFTSRQEKYIKMNPREFELRLSQLFVG